MVRASKRNFALRDAAGDDGSVFSGNSPRQAALEAVKRLDVADSREEAEANKRELRLRERGTDKVYVYEAWAWREEAPDNGPEWMPSSTVHANVAKRDVERLD